MDEWQCCHCVCDRESVRKSQTVRVLKRAVLTDCQPIIHLYTCTNLSCRSTTASLWFPRLLAAPPHPPLSLSPSFFQSLHEANPIHCNIIRASPCYLDSLPEPKRHTQGQIDFPVVLDLWQLSRNHIAQPPAPPHPPPCMCTHTQKDARTSFLPVSPKQFRASSEYFPPSLRHQGQRKQTFLTHSDGWCPGVVWKFPSVAVSCGREERSFSESAEKRSPGKVHKTVLKLTPASRWLFKYTCIFQILKLCISWMFLVWDNSVCCWFECVHVLVWQVVSRYSLSGCRLFLSALAGLSLPQKWVEDISITRLNLIHITSNFPQTQHRNSAVISLKHCFW